MRIGTDQRWSTSIRQAGKGYSSDVLLNLLTRLTRYSACVVCHGRLKPLIGLNDTETTAGQTQQLLKVLSAMDVMWSAWHFVSVDKMNR